MLEKRKCFQENHKRGTLVALLFKRLTLEFSLGHDVGVMRLSPSSGSMLGLEPA